MPPGLRAAFEAEEAASRALTEVALTTLDPPLIGANPGGAEGVLVALGETEGAVEETAAGFGDKGPAGLLASPKDDSDAGCGEV